jgi:hypothetical protein
MEEETTPVQDESATPAENKFECPECKEENIVTLLPTRRTLGMHRWFKHGVRGITYQEKPEKPSAKKTLGHPKKAKNPKAITKQPVPQQVQPPANSASEISPELLGYALGKIESLAELIARDNGLPTQEFVARVMEYYAVLPKR